MSYNNEMTLRFSAIKENESFARLSVASFVSNINPTIEEIGDIKTALSEAITNSIVHAYPKNTGDVIVNVKISDNDVYITVTDYGIGIEDIDQAKQPFYTSKPETERSGMGFTVMEGFMDSVQVISSPNKGVIVSMYKKVGVMNMVVGGWNAWCITHPRIDRRGAKE